MPAWKLALALAAIAAATAGAACSSSGSSALTGDGGTDATVGGDDASDAGPEGAADAGSDVTALLPCFDISMVGPRASSDCVYAGPCPEDCLAGTASSYACVAGPPVVFMGATIADASPTYPAVFTQPTGVVSIIAAQGGQYPWDGSVFVSCGPLSCVRWATGDHGASGSSWPADPCADAGTDAGAATAAWTCPLAGSVVPPGAGCFNAGTVQHIGGPGTGVPEQSVWCCPPGASADAGADASAGADSGAGAGAGGSDGGAG